MTQTQTYPRIDLIEARIAPLRDRLTRHPLYAAIRTPAHLRLFMESHIFAVWDFMSLLKALQARLTCVAVPWTPSRFPASRRFINEIVLGEESDEYLGRPISHFELYLEAMTEFGADTRPMRALLADVAGSQGGSNPAAGKGGKQIPFGNDNKMPAAARDFIANTFDVIGGGSLPAMAAAFTFGREDVIPDIFRELVRDMNGGREGRPTGDLGKFVWYLERHIEVDGEDHGPLSLRMVADLCGTEERLWEEAAAAAEAAIAARLRLWDGIYSEILQS